MPAPDPLKIIAFKTPDTLAQWLKANHATETELWVKMFKKHSGIDSVSWNEVVMEALCWGWIDGIKKSIDNQSYLQRITPRKSKSQWSKRNTEHVARLIIEGRMQAQGLVHVDAAKADGRWANAYVVGDIDIPEDFIAAVGENLNAKTFFGTLTKSSRYVIAHALISAKKPETRQRRFEKYMNMLAEQQKPT
ncbi:YdeI/OmpD-associated family protein [Motilimonas pumila]|uniref:Bacteriocin-protection protein n=1 Tax=Motilimonas pumila TaxID=2303987 RepID=A0A418YF12_9GAMM|nr:YdeI/OmpD-associated family protein [Motilimonas pumila]RJG47770.1 hypothetical protein D1Z90_10250 [Motilimonas pumila]